MQKEFKLEAQLIKGEVDLKYLQRLAPFDFQNWVIVEVSGQG